MTFTAASTACAPGSTIPETSITDTDLESYFRNHMVDGNHVAAIKKRSVGVVSYLATVHGYPNNLSVCEELIKPYNVEVCIARRLLLRGAAVVIPPVTVPRPR